MAEFFQSISPNTYMTLSLIVFSVTLLMRSRHYFKKSKTRTELTSKEAEAVKVAPGKRPQVVTVRSEGQGVPQRIVKTPETPQPFAGTTIPSEVSRWEVEIHELGRQTLAQIDTKLIALQTLATEVNQVGQRVELMIEHLENLLKNPRPPVPTSMPDAESAVTVTETALPQKTHDGQERPRILSAGSSEQEGLSPLGDLLEEFEQEKQAWEEAETLERTSMAGTMQPMDMSRVVTGKTVSDSAPARILEPHPSRSQSPVLPTSLPEIEKELPLPHIALLDEKHETETDPDFSAVDLSALRARPSRLARRFLAEDTTPLPQQSATLETVAPNAVPPANLSPRPAPVGPTLSFSRSSVYDAPPTQPSSSSMPLQPRRSASPPFPHPQPVGHQVPPVSPTLLHFPSHTEAKGSDGIQTGTATPVATVPVATVPVATVPVATVPAATAPTTAALGYSADTGPGDKAPQFSSLFEQGRQKPNIVAGPPAAVSSTQGVVSASPGLADREENLDLRQQIFLLSDYGYQAKEIAAQLSRPVGEIEFVLNLRQTGNPPSTSTGRGS